jgi:hypothetical protein
MEYGIGKEDNKEIKSDMRVHRSWLDAAHGSGEGWQSLRQWKGG